MLEVYGCEVTRVAAKWLLNKTYDFEELFMYVTNRLAHTID